MSGTAFRPRTASPRSLESVLTTMQRSGDRSILVRGRPDVGPAKDLLAALAAIPEERVWLEKQRSERTRRAYRKDVAEFLAAVGVKTPEDFRRVKLSAVLAWQRQMEDVKLSARTVRRRLSALSSLFTHLAQKGLVDGNPVREATRPKVNRKKGVTPAFSKKQARALLDAPDPSTVQGLRDRAILAVGLQVGCRRSEIAHLTVASLHMDNGFASLRVLLKGGEEISVAINPQVQQRIQAYLDAAGHVADRDGPLFRPLRDNGDGQERRRHLHPDVIDRILKKWARKALRVPQGKTVEFSAHSMRATFITTALENGAALEDVQRDVGHADPSTTKLYDRRGHNVEKSASFFANY